jgi:hypothetical protein
MFEEILRRIADVEDQVRTVTRLGKVTAVDATALSLTVEVAGQSIPGVRWVQPYTSPTVGDFVAVTRNGESWLCLGELSRDLTGPGYEAAVITVSPSTRLAALRQVAGSGAGPSWSWVHDHDDMHQGHNVRSGGNQFFSAGIALYAPLASYVPDGATITACKVRFWRSAFLWDDGSLSNTSALVIPRIYGHARTPATPPTTQDPTTLWTAGYGPWSPGSLQRGEVGQWDLPSAWLTAWLAGTITGLGTWSDQISDHTWWQLSASLTISYTVPA